jgi:uncharacterized protein (DUF2147 family)
MTNDKSLLKSALHCMLLCTGLVVASPAFAEGGPVGVWRLSTGKVTVRVNYCGGRNLCATIVGLAQPLNSAGQPKTDHENPNHSLRGRRVVGLQVVSGMVPAGENRWKGRIYNADDGGTYRSEMRLSGNSMVISGCWGPFCKKNRFIRVR